MLEYTNEEISEVQLIPGFNVVQTTKRSLVLSAANQRHQQLSLFLLVDVDEPIALKKIWVIRKGDQVPNVNLEFINTVFFDGFYNFVFEEVE